MNINFRSVGASAAKKATAVGLSVLLAAPIVGADDFGEQVEHLLKAQSQKLFGVVKPIEDSAPPTVGSYRAPNQPALAQVLLAKGLKVKYLTREAGNNADMMAFFPAETPTNERGPWWRGPVPCLSTNFIPALPGRNVFLTPAMSNTGNPKGGIYGTNGFGNDH